MINHRGMKKGILMIALFTTLGCSKKEVTPLWIDYHSGTEQGWAQEFIDERKEQEEHPNLNDYCHFVYSREEGVVPDAQTAALIGKAILEAATGEKCILPLKVELVDSLIWVVENGTPKKMQFVGAKTVLIKKSDAQVLAIHLYK